MFAHFGSLQLLEGDLEMKRRVGERGKRGGGKSRLMEHEVCTWEIPEIPWL